MAEAMAGASPSEGAAKLLPVKRELEEGASPERSEPAKDESQEVKVERRVVRKTAPKDLVTTAVKSEQTGSGKASTSAPGSRGAVVQRKPAARRGTSAVKDETFEEEAPEENKWRRKRKAIEVKREPVEAEPPPPLWELRLPFYIAQCKAFQLAKRKWKRSRPCCAANCLQHVAERPDEGQSCYERMSPAQKQRFEKLIANPLAAIREKPKEVSLRLFRSLLHPEREPDLVVRRARVEDEPEVSSAVVPFQVPKHMAIGGESPSLAKALAMAKARQEKMRKVATRMGNRASGVPGVRWHEKTRAWVASWKGDSDSQKSYKEKDRCFQSFPVDEYMIEGRTEEEANEEARQEAIVFRERLVSQGIVKVAHVGSSKGIAWNKVRKGWDVFIRAYGKKMRGGFFKPVDGSAAASERAWQAAIEFREQLEMRHGRHGSTIQRQVLQQDLEPPPTPAPASQLGAGAVAEEDLDLPPTPAPASQLGAGASAEEAAAEGADEDGAAVELGDGGEAAQEQVVVKPEGDGGDEVPSVVVPDDVAPATGSSAGASSEASTTRGKGGLVGVTWRRQGCHWRVQMWVNGKLDRRLFKPQEDKPEDIERELLAACRQDSG